MSETNLSPTLDDVVFPLRERLRGVGVADPDVLLFLGTGVGFLPSRLDQAMELELGELLPDGEPWSAQVLRTGVLAGAQVWCVEDVSGDPAGFEVEEPWMRALPVWLAASAGCSVAVHTSAASALSPAAPRRGLAVVSDHLNVSGASPLLGLGESKLGPLFPDLSRLYHEGLRGAAAQRAAALGIELPEVVAACTLGPALETAAERRMLATLGADVAVPDLASWAPPRRSSRPSRTCWSP
jgi:purine-nucleoside phosphorylase